MNERRSVALQRGSSLVEAVLVGLVLLIPLLWTLTVLSELHRGALAATAAVREAGAGAARSGDRAVAGRVVEAAVTDAFRDHGLDPADAVVRWSGSLERGTPVEIQIRYPVPVMRVPFVGALSQASIWVEARHRARVDLYRSRAR